MLPFAHPMDLPAYFGKYLLVHQLGRGGMAELFLAKQSGLKGFEKVLAIKKILPHLTQDPEFVSMFVNEGKLAALLTHQHIVQIFDLGNVDGAYYMAMEYVMGKDLRTLAVKAREHGGRLALDHALSIISQVASGLDYAHRKKDLNGHELNIVHRDVSPQNILVSYEGEVKLVDFGIAKAAGLGQETQTGILKGKLAYMSPEQACGKPIDRRSDVFSLGIVCYELLTGRRLFKGDSDLSTLEQVRTAVIEPPTRFDAEIPPALETVVLKALAREPDQRYQTASEFQAALEQIMADRGQAFSSLQLSQWMASLFADDVRRDAERLQSTHQETVRLGAAPRAAKVVPLTPRRPAPAHDTPPAATRAAPRSEGHPWRTAALAAGLLFVLGGATVVASPAVLEWMRTQSPEVRRAGLMIETRLADLGLGHLRPPRAIVPAPVAGAIAMAPDPMPDPVVDAETPSPASDGTSLQGEPVAVAAPTVVESPVVAVPARPDIKPLLQQAKVLYAEGRLDAVEDVLRTALERDPHSPLAYHLLGTVYLERKEETRAFEVFSQAAHQFPDNATLRYDLGFLYAQRGLTALAREELSRALALQPNGGPAARARLILRGGDGPPKRPGVRSMSDRPPRDAPNPPTAPPEAAPPPEDVTPVQAPADPPPMEGAEPVNGAPP